MTTSLDDRMAAHVEDGSVPGLAWSVVRRRRVEQGAAGAVRTGGPPVGSGSIFRISSMTKPVTAVAVLRLVEDGALSLDDAVDRWLPELADRRVLRDPAGPLDDTVPAIRPVTVEDLLTSRCGIGWDFAADWERQPVMQELDRLDLGAGPPRPAGPPPPDEWMRRIGTLPLSHQPGSRWLYHVAAELAGVLVSRVHGSTLDEVLRAEVLDPLGMHDTGFSVAPPDRARFTSCYGTDPSSGSRSVFDAPDGDWAAEPDFPSGGAGLVSTVDDYRRFASMLMGGGSVDGTRILEPATVRTMTTDHIGGDRAAGGPSADGALGWGLGLAVQRRRDGLRPAGSYGWDGGLGSSWANDPSTGLIGVLLTNQAWASPDPPPVVTDFWQAARAAPGG